MDTTRPKETLRNHRVLAHLRFHRSLIWMDHLLRFW